ncbi:MAG TPA: hypothetical protein ENH78_11140 [Phycisphaerae bacterium]|nr:hypothetical protein [Phycisphaerae bacterium]
MAIATGCSKSSSRQAAFEETKQQGNYQLIASTAIDGDRVEVWGEAREPGNLRFGRFLMAAVAQSGDLLDFCAGEFVSSSIPFFQSPRYVALVASVGLGKEREVFFVYDARSKKFLTCSVDEFVDCGVHKNILIVGDIAFFASCKTPTPVGRLVLTTKEVTMFGTPAPQGASFYLVGSDVFVKGHDQRVHRVDEEGLIEVDTQVREDQITEMDFDAIMINKKGSEQSMQATRRNR